MSPIELWASPMDIDQETLFVGYDDGSMPDQVWRQPTTLPQLKIDNPNHQPFYLVLLFVWQWRSSEYL